MKIHYPDGCEQAWRDSLSDSQRETLADLHRQGKHLRDRTNHGSDERWMQAGCKTYSWQEGARRTSRTDRYAHEAVVIRRESYGYRVIGVRRAEVFSIDPETGDTTPIQGWRIAWLWYVTAGGSQSWDPAHDAEVRGKFAHAS